jgi:hypothetical protein
MACHDDGDPDRPEDMVDLYVARHYGMVNPDPSVIEGHHHRIAHVLEQAAIPHEDHGGSVVRGEDVPTENLLPVLDTMTGRSTGFLVQGGEPAEIDRKLTAMANALGCPREDLTV